MELNLCKSKLWVKRITKKFNQEEEEELERKKKVKIEN